MTSWVIVAPLSNKRNPQYLQGGEHHEGIGLVFKWTRLHEEALCLCTERDALTLRDMLGLFEAKVRKED